MRAAPHHQGNTRAAMVTIPKAMRPKVTTKAPAIRIKAERLALNLSKGMPIPARTIAAPAATVREANAAVKP